MNRQNSVVEYVFVLPLPYKCLLTNAKRGLHYRIVHSGEQLYKAACCKIIQSTLKGQKPLIVGATLVIEWYGGKGRTPKEDYFAPARPHDCDNAQSGCKMAIDALTEAGVVFNDSAKYIRKVSLELFPQGTKDRKDTLVLTICSQEP